MSQDNRSVNAKSKGKRITSVPQLNSTKKLQEQNKKMLSLVGSR